MREIVAPVVGSTLTTVVVFVPLGMLSGVVGQFFKALSITLAAAVLISLVQALTLIPLLARWAARRREAAPEAAHAHAAGAHGAVLLADARFDDAAPGDRPAGRAASWRSPASCSSRASARASCRRRTKAASSSTTSSPAGSALEETNKILRERRGGAAEDAGHRGVHAPHRLGARPVRDAAEQGRHPGPAEAARPAPRPPTRSIERPARQAAAKPRRSSTSSSCSCCRT